MASSSRFPDLDHARRARLLGALARALDAGLPADRALEAATDVAGPQAAPHIARAAGSVARGTSLSRVLRRAGVLVGPDAALMEAGEQAGATAPVLAGLAARFERLASRSRQVRTRLALPLAVLAIGILVLPLPALVVGDLDATGYLAQTLAAAALVGLLLWLGVRAARALTRGALPAWMQTLPLVGPLLAEQVRLVTLEQLHALLAAGVAAQAAVTTCRRAGAGGLQRRWLDALGARLRAGDGLAEALLDSGLLRRGDEHGLLASGEAAGRLEETLQRVLDGARGAFEGRLDLAAEWTPRLVYGVVVAVLAVGMLG